MHIKTEPKCSPKGENMRTISHTAFAVTASVFALALAIPAMAQDDNDESDEIVVTATKRVEDVQDVPISISAYDAKFIEESGVKNIYDISLYTPNFTLGNSSQLTNNRIIIRGVGSVGNGGIEPSVGVFIDGIYYPRPGSVIGNLVDIEGFEVLRGPQGTLFGRNTPMGALNIRTKDPKLGTDGVHGYLDLGAGSFSAYSAAGAVNIPLGQNSAVRIAAKYSTRDGYGTNLMTGKNYGARGDTSVRAKFLTQPNDHFKVKMTLDYADIDSGGSSIEYLNSTSSPVFLGTLQALAGSNAANLLTSDPYDHDVYQDTRDRLDDSQWGAALEMSYEFESGYKLRSITSVRNWEAHYFESAIRLPIQLFPRLTDYKNDTFSEEIHFLSPEGGAFDYLLGAYYYNESYYISQDFNLGAQFCIPVVYGLAGPAAAAGCLAYPQVRASNGEFDQKLSSVAAFGQGTFHFTDKFSLTLGGRFTSDDKTADFSNTVSNPFVLALGVRDNEVHNDLNINENGYGTSQFTYFANTSFHPTDDVMLFATASSGYKSGGFNTDGVFPALTRAQRIFGPEDTNNWEIGMKSEWMDKAVRLNVTAFRMDIDGFQDRAFDGISFVTRNAGSLRQQGVEADGMWRLHETFALSGAVSYLDSEFLEYINASPLPGGPLQNLTGQRAHYSPDWQGSLIADYSTPLAGMNGNVFSMRGEMQFVGDQNVGANTNENPQSIQGGYTLFNGRIGLRSASGRWDFTLWGKNLTDKGYCVVMFDQPFGAQLGGLDPVAHTIPQRCAVGVPRTFGVQLRIKN